MRVYEDREQEQARVEWLASAVNEAGSLSWSVRAAAGRRLAEAAQEPEVIEVLHRLLLDPDDTGVTQETAEALLQRGDAQGLRVVLAALARAQNLEFAGYLESADHLVAAIACDPRWMTESGAGQLVEQLRELTSDEDVGVRNEAQNLLLGMGKSVEPSA